VTLQLAEDQGSDHLGRDGEGYDAPSQGAMAPSSLSAKEMVTVSEDKKDSAQEEEWIRQLNLIYAGLIVVGVYMVQPFLTAGSLDLSAEISVVSFSEAIPLLAALAVINQQEVFRRRLTPSRIVAITRPVAQTCAFVGLVAAFWHISWLAGAGMLAGGIVGVGVHSAGFVRLEHDAWPPGTDDAGE
jgi:hypothetical protein